MHAITHYFAGEDCRDSSQEKTPTREPRPDTEQQASDPRDAISEASERGEAGDTHQDQTARISQESDEPALVKPEKLGEQEQSDPYPGEEVIQENLSEKETAEEGIENPLTESQDSDRGGGGASESESNGGIGRSSVIRGSKTSGGGGGKS